MGRGWVAAVVVGAGCAQLLGLEDVELEGPPMFSVAASSFTMGCGDVPASCDTDELPTHEVTVSRFEIDETEVSRADYQRCVDAGVCLPASCAPGADDADLPVTCVSWYQAEIYCQRLGKRLPTEAEWEKAARGPNDGRPYPWGTDAPTCMHANHSGCTGNPDPVGTHPLGRSPYGPLDLAGNVAEWVADLYDAAYYTDSPVEDPVGPEMGVNRVQRGGGFGSGPGGIRVSTRDGYDPTRTDPTTGFRCAR